MPAIQPLVARWLADPGGETRQHSVASARRTSAEALVLTLGIPIA